MQPRNLPPIAAGYEVFAEDGGEVFGAVRDASGRTDGRILVDIENAGAVEIPLEAVRAVHYGKVILDVDRLDRRTREAIRHAHDRELPGL